MSPSHQYGERSLPTQILLFFVVSALSNRSRAVFVHGSFFFFLTTDDTDNTDFFFLIRAHPCNPWFYSVSPLHRRRKATNPSPTNAMPERPNPRSKSGSEYWSLILWRPAGTSTAWNP